MKLEILLDFKDFSIENIKDNDIGTISGYSSYSEVSNRKLIKIFIEGPHLENIEDTDTKLVINVRDNEESIFCGKIKQVIEERNKNGEVIKITTEYF